MQAYYSPQYCHFIRGFSGLFKFVVSSQMCCVILLSYLTGAEFVFQFYSGLDKGRFILELIQVQMDFEADNP